MKTIDATNLDYRALNGMLRQLHPDVEEVRIRGVNGQRYIAAGMSLPAQVTIEGTAGNDLVAFADGVDVVVTGNAQDGVGNTLCRGRLVVKGHAADLLAHSMRGGEIFVRGDVGYRAAIHMKSYGDRTPLVMIGGRAGDFLGEYMAGGDLVVLGLGHERHESAGRFIGTGMHGGRIFIRGQVEPWHIGREVIVGRPDEGELAFLRSAVSRFEAAVDLKVPPADASDYLVLTPRSARPYGAMYA